MLRSKPTLQAVCASLLCHRLSCVTALFVPHSSAILSRERSSSPHIAASYRCFTRKQSLAFWHMVVSILLLSNLSTKKFREWKSLLLFFPCFSNFFTTGSCFYWRSSWLKQMPNWYLREEESAFACWMLKYVTVKQVLLVLSIFFFSCCERLWHMKSSYRIVCRNLIRAPKCPCLSPWTKWSLTT